MPALVAGIHVFLHSSSKDVDGRVKPGHDKTIRFRQKKKPRPGGEKPGGAF
jgi:hypothetical protein